MNSSVSVIGGLVLVFVVILISMVLHEIAHGLVAYWLGDDTAKTQGRLSLNPLKHLDPITSFALPLILYLMGGPIFGGAKPVPINTRNLKGGAWGMALVAIAGPLTNFLLALISFLIGYWTGLISYDGIMLSYQGFGGMIFTYFITINLGFGIFNMLPIPPLDGSRVLYAIVPDGIRRGMEWLEQFGIWIIAILVVLGGSLLSFIMTGAVQGLLNFFYWIVGG